MALRIQINPDRIFGKRSPMLYGQFIEHFHRQIYGGIKKKKNPLSDEDGFRTDIIEAMKRIRGAEVTRFKGLGEISPKEFRRFISEDIKLLPVTITSIKDIRDKMEFYMGDNTPQRKEFIMENLLNVSG